MFTRTSVISALLAVATAAPSFKSFSGPSSKWTHAISDASSTSDWDYIIAGAGPAGIIVAQRLAEQYKKVLLLEVGGPSTQSSGGNASTTWTSNGLTVYDVPSQQGSIFSTGAAHTCTDTPGTAGCLLGGGVEINALVFVKPADHDFDDKWPVGWKWADIEESANSLYERNPPTTTPSADGESYDTAEFDILSSFLDTQRYTQVDATVDTNAKKSVYSRPPWNAINGERAGPVRTYLPLAQNMTNFSLQMYTKVIRVVRDGGKATGVEVEDSNTGARSVISICSSGRIVLAAGSMRTPAILINSGIGPADQIAIVANGTNNITLPDKSDYINLPVGTQIKDHPIVTVIFNTTSNLTLYPYAKPTAADQELYLTNRTGVLTQNTQRLIFWDSFVGSDNVTRYIQGTTGPYATNQLSIKFYLTHGSTSIGQLGMSSTGATTLITSPYFQTEADTTGLTNYISSFMAATTSSGILYPSTNETASSLLTTGLSSGTHYVGTAKIGTDDGRKGGEAVVDTNTKVYGMDNLFVVDASIHADLPTGNTQAIVMVVAEKAAQKILALR